MPPIPSNVVHPQADPEEPDEDLDAGLAAYEAINPEAEAAKAAAAHAGAPDSGPFRDVGLEDDTAVNTSTEGEGQPGDAAALPAAASDAAPRLRRRHPKSQPAAADQHGGPAGALGPLAIFTALAAGSWLLWRLMRRRRRGTPAESAGDPAAARALTGKLSLPAAPAQPPPAAPQPLADTTFAVDDLFDIEGESRDATGNGSAPPAERTAPLLAALQRAGASGTAKAATPDLNLGLLGALEDMPANPAAAECVTGGAGAGCASAVAAGDVTFAVSVDHLAGVRVAAACCGAYGFRASAGAVPLQGVASTAPSLEAVAWAAADAATLQRVGAALELPGKVTQGEVIRIIIAKDLFAGCDGAMAVAYAALQAAARSWAGEELVHRMPLCVFLAEKVPALGHFRVDDDTTVLDALVDAAEALQVAQLQASHPARVDDLEQVSEDSLAAARQVAAQAREALRRACAGGVVLALPALPGHPPPRNAPQTDLHAFEDRVLQLTALAALTGAPQVVIPVKIPGSPPLAVALLGAPRSDTQLLHVAGKLGPLINRAAPEIAAAAPQLSGGASADQPRQAHQTQQAASRPGKGGAQSGGGSVAAGTASPSRSGAGSPAPSEQASLAQKAKDEGNRAFKEGDYWAAIQAYSAAIQQDPSNPVYYSNRAIAALKVMEFDQAEEDADAALRLEAPVLNPKTLLRRGTARLGLKKIAAARADFRQVVSLEPANRQAREELRALEGVDDDLFAGGSQLVGSGNMAL